MSESGGVEPNFLAIVGPTGVGKSALGIDVALRLRGEIVSVDSRQVYRGMDIGTAKVTASQRAAVVHHGLDIRSPDERYSAGEFGRDARGWIAEIRSRGRLPILVGGTGFFLRTLMEPLFREPPLDPDRCRALEDALGGLSRSELARWVRGLDSRRAGVAAEGGAQRMIRTLAVTMLTGHPLSSWHRDSPPDGDPLSGVVCVLTLPRDVLAWRIERRAQAMVADGLIQEVEALLAAGHRPGDPGMTGVGYREVVDHLAGRITVAEAIERMTVATRRYAKRQETWFRRQLGPRAARIDAALPGERLVRAALAVWARRSVGHRSSATG